MESQRKMYTLSIALCALLLQSPTCYAAESRDASWQLVTDLFTDYIPDIVPRCHNGVPIVWVDMSLRSILDVDEPRQIVTANVWLRWKWNDCRLSWNESQYGNLTHILVSAKRVWIPDISLYDSAGSGFESVDEEQVKMHSDGTIRLLAPVIIKFTCKMDVAYFPFDLQICRLKYASWSYTGLELDVENTTALADTSVLVDNGEWKVLEIPVRRKVKIYPCCVEPFPEVTFYFVMQRQYLYYMFNLVMPCLLITGIGLLVFLMPPESGEKMSMGITVLLSLCVFLLMVADRMPATSETIPLIGQYFGATIIMVSVSCGLTVLVLNTHHQGTNGYRVPNWVRVLVLRGISRLLCMRSQSSAAEQRLHDHKYGLPQKCGLCLENVQMHVVGERLFNHYHNNEEKEKLKNCTTFKPNSNVRCSPMDNSPIPFRYDITSPKEEQTSPTCDSNTVLLQDTARILQEFREVLDDKLASDEVENEWREVAVVLDRLFFILVSSITIIVTFVILVFQRDNIYDINLLEKLDIN